MVIALLTLLVITMMVGAVATAMPVQLFAAVHGGETQAALLAARSGMDYAFSRLQENRMWMGNGDGATPPPGARTIVNTPQLQVVEDEGNVIGVLVHPDGTRSAFRMKFNYQNGGSTSPDDGFPNDPAATHKITNSYLCFNNIPQSVTIPTFQANASTGVVVNTPTGDLPKFNASIQVEGLGGPGLSNATVDNLDVLMSSPGTRSRIYTQHLGGRYNVSGSSQIDSVVSAASTFAGAATALVGGEFKVVEAPNTSPPKLRSRASANLTSGMYNTTGEVRVDDDAGSSMPGTTPVQEDANLQDSHFLRVKTAQVQKATAADTRIKAGTYVWRQAGSSYKLDYYEQNFNGTVPTGAPTDTLNGPGDYSRFISNGSAISFDFSQMAGSLTDKVYVNPQGPVTDMAIVIEPSVQAALGQRPTLTFVDAGNSSILSSPGNITVQGSLDGFGGVTSDRSITFQGASAFETDPDNSICVYAGEDVNINAIPDTVITSLTSMVGGGIGMGMGKKVGFQGMGGMSMGMATPVTTTAFTANPGDVSMSGIIYALGDFNVNLSTSLLPVNHGNFYMEGVLTAFGGNPDAGDLPGANGKGHVNIRAANAEFYFDPSYLEQLQGGGGANGVLLEQVGWNLIP